MTFRLGLRPFLSQVHDAFCPPDHWEAPGGAVGTGPSTSWSRPAVIQSFVFFVNDSQHFLLCGKDKPEVGTLGCRALVGKF